MYGILIRILGEVVWRMVRYNNMIKIYKMYATNKRNQSFSNRKKNTVSGLSQFITNLGVKPLKKTFHRSTKNQLRVEPIFKNAAERQGTNFFDQR
jgi:hypothetical protein